MLPENEIKAQLSIAYVHAIVSMIGCEVKSSHTDYDSIDLTLAYGDKVSEDSIYESTEIGIQLKCTSSIALTTDDTDFSFNLRMKNYNDLRKQCVVPRILVVLCLPSLSAEWLKHSCDELVIKRCAYWISLSGQPEVNGQQNKTVKIPVKNVFSPESLKLILDKVSKEVEL